VALRDEFRQFMVACEVILDCSVNEDELDHFEHELLQYYVFKVAQKFPLSHPDQPTERMEGNFCYQPQTVL